MNIGKNTDLEIAQQELKQAGKTIKDFKTALDEHAIVATTDSKGKITYVNEKFCAISQYSREELLGQDHRILNSAHHPKDFFKVLWNTIRSGDTWHGDIKNCRKDGSFYWVSTTIVPFLGEDGKPEQYIAIRADISDQKLYEERLEEAMSELERKNKELEAVVYAASHDLRSPLVNVQGFAAVLSEQVEEFKSLVLSGGVNDSISEELNTAESEIKQSLGFIDAGASKMDALLNGLLAISRVGRAEVVSEMLDVAELVQSNLAAIQFQIDQAKADITVGDLPEAYADQNLLSQVFANLIGNALKYASPERLLVLGIQGERMGGKVTYHVSDNGIGIAEAHQERVFDLFHRLNPVDSEGQGIGLSIVARALERMGGQIILTSVEGEGSRFSIELPCRSI